MKTAMENIWAANIVTGGTVLLVMGWLFNRFVKSYDDRITTAEKKAAEIEKNYIQRFEEVHEKIDDSAAEIKEHFNKEIADVIRDKNEYRIQQSRTMGAIEAKLDYLIKNK